MVFDKMGKPEETLKNYNKSLEIKIRVVGHNHPLVAGTRNKCAQLFCFFLLVE